MEYASIVPDLESADFQGWGNAGPGGSKRGIPKGVGYSSLAGRDCFLFADLNFFLFFVNIGVKGREGDKKGNADQIFNALDVGVEINHCV